MPYITSFERDGIILGSLQTARESAIKVLETRFSALPASLIESVNGIEDMDRLQRLLVSAVTVASVEEFEQVLAQAES